MGARGTRHSRKAWNKGKLVGQKLPLKVKDIGRYAFAFRCRNAFATLHCSIWGSTASCEHVILSNFTCGTFVTATVLQVAQSCCNRRRSDQFNLRLRVDARSTRVMD